MQTSSRTRCTSSALPGFSHASEYRHNPPFLRRVTCQPDAAGLPSSITGVYQPLYCNLGTRSARTELRYIRIGHMRASVARFVML